MKQGCPTENQTPPGPPAPSIEAATQGHDAFLGCRVLVADDVLMNRDVVAGMLDSLGCEVVEVVDGAEAVDAVREHRARGTGFDAVFMDCQMPVMDGLVAATAIRTLEAEGEFDWPRLPIIALTGFTGRDERERCLDAGMDDFITKPLSVKTAANMLRAHVERRGTSNHGAGAVISDHAPLPVPAPRKTLVDPSIFDPKEVLNIVGGSTALMKRMLENFGVSSAFEDAQAALAESDAAKLRKAAHSVKGQLRYMQAHSAVELASALETEARALEAEQAAADDRTWTWSGGCSERLTKLTASLGDQVERVAANRSAVLARCGA